MNRFQFLAALLLCGATTQTWAQSVPATSKSPQPASATKKPSPAYATFGPPSGNPPPHPGRAIRERFEKADADHNGKINQKEADAGMPIVAKDFATIDTGKTGEITVDQVLAYFEHKREARRQSAADPKEAAPAAPKTAASATPAAPAGHTP